MYRTITFTLLVFMIGWSSANADSILLEKAAFKSFPIVNYSNTYDVQNQLFYFIDKNKKLKIEDFLAKNPPNEEWQQNTESKNYFPTSPFPYWIVLNLDKKTDIPLVFHLRNFSFESLEAWIISEGQLKKKLDTGFKRSNRSKVPKPYNNSFLIPENPGNNIQIVVRAISKDGDFSVNLSTIEHYDREILLVDLIKGAYFGILFLLIFNSLALYFTKKVPTYLFYSIFCICMLFRVAEPFHIFIFLSNGILNISKYVDFIAMLTLLSSAVFINSLLELKKRAPLFKFLINISTVFLVATYGVHLLNSELFDYNIFYRLFNLYFGILFLAIGAYLSFKRYRPAYWFTLGWGAFISGIIIWALSALNVIESNIYTAHIAVVGAIFEMLVMMIAIADKTKLDKKIIAKAKEKVQESQKIAKLMRVLVHDIANPLTIIGMISKKMYVNKSATTEHITKLRKATEILFEIVNHVKEMESLRTGKKQIELSKIDIIPILNDLTTIFEENLREKSIHLKLNYNDFRNLFAIADSASFRNEVLNNLVSNAIKFSPIGSTIEIDISSKKGKSILKIVDEGIGIPTDILENIFKPDYNTSRKGTENEKGTGFGMPIVKNYMDLYGATINITSVPKIRDVSENKSGTTITLEFLTDEKYIDIIASDRLKNAS